MERVWPFVLLAIGCYHPAPPGGAPCSPTGACPSGFVCTTGNVCTTAGDAGPSDGAPDATDGSAGPVLVHARVGVTEVGKTGALREVTDPGTLAVWLADGTTPAITITPDGSIEFQRAATDQRYDITDGTTTVEAATSTVTYLPPVFGRVGAVIPASATDVQVQLANPDALAAGSTTLLARGSRAVASSPSSGSPFLFTIDWSAVSSPNGPAPLLDANAGDELWFLHVTQDPSSRTVIDGSAVANISLVDGQLTTVPATYAHLAQTGCLSVAAPVAEEIARMAAATTEASGMPSASVGEETQPPARSVSGGQFPLAQIPVSNDATVQLPVHQPFTGEDQAPFLLVTQPVTHTVTRSGPPTPLAGYATELVLGDPSAADPTCSTTVHLPAGPGFPTAFTVGGTALAADSTSIVVPSNQETAVAFALSPGAGATTYLVDLVDVTDGGRTTVGSWVGTAPVFHIQPGRFVNSHAYQLVTVVSFGAAGAAAGDLTSVTYPIGVTVEESPTFVVTIALPP